MLLNIEKGTDIKDIIFWEQDGGIFGRFKLIQFLPPTGFYSRNTYRDSRRKFPHFQFPPDTCNVAFNVSRVREMEIRGERRRERERESNIAFIEPERRRWLVRGRTEHTFISLRFSFRVEMTRGGTPGQTQIHFLNVVLYARNCTENTYSRGGGVGQCERGGSITNAIKLSVDGSRSVLVYQDEAASVEC